MGQRYHEQSSKPPGTALRMRRRVTREKMEKRPRLVFALISGGLCMNSL